MVTWDRTPLGLETATPGQPRAALAVEGSEGRWILRYSKFPALHREAERDTTGSFSRQPLVHTWIGLGVQGKRRSPATLHLIRPGNIKLRLTLWFYCGKRAARRHGFVEEPRKSSCFVGKRAGVRRSIFVFRCHPRWRDRGAIAGADFRLECCRGFRRSAGWRRQANPLRSRSRQDDTIPRLCARRSL